MLSLYSGSTSAAAAERYRSTLGSARARSSDSSSMWPEPVMAQAKRGLSWRRRADAVGCAALMRGSAPAADPASVETFAARELDVEAVELAVERVAAERERFGDIADVPAVVLEHAQQRLPLGRLDRGQGWMRRGRFRNRRSRVVLGGLFRQLLGQLLQQAFARHRVAVVKRRERAQHVAQLAHVARPGMFQQRGLGIGGERKTRAFFGQDAPDQRDLAGPVTQPRQRDRHAIQAEEQVLAEQARADLFFRLNGVSIT